MLSIYNMLKKNKSSFISLLLGHFVKMDMVTHVLIGSFIRLLLVIYGIWHDQTSEVPFTDIDYKVFTDAARHVVNGSSPYERDTFRYSPIIAFLLTPNIFFHPVFGKIIFCGVDLLVAYSIRRLVYCNVLQWIKFTKIQTHSRHIKRSNSEVDEAIYWAHRAMLFWLYNPMTLVISTRGNSDSLSCLLVIVTLYLLQKNYNSFLVGLLHGLSIHFRLYPIIYSFTFFMYLSKFSFYIDNGSKSSANMKKSRNKRKHIMKKYPSNVGTKSIFRKDIFLYLIPNKSQIMLTSGVLTSLSFLTGIFYFCYGYKFLYESLIYHLVRIDFKHNFSLYFYLQYLSAWVKFETWSMGIWQPILMNLPPIILMLYFSIYFGLNQYALNFTILSQTIVFVIYNKVLTSQYFVWIMGLLPLCIWQIKLSRKTVLFLTSIWFLAQAAWLLPAYLLEFQGENTFLYIWIQGVSLFCAHVGILGRVLKSFILTMHEFKRTD